MRIFLAASGLGLDTIIIRDVNLGASSDLAPTDKTPVLVHTTAERNFLAICSAHLMYQVKKIDYA